MKNLFIIISLLLLSTVLYAQSIEFKVGTEYRITPIEKPLNDHLRTGNVYFSSHRQLTGTAFNYSIAYVMEGGFGFGFSHAVQYSHIYYEPSEFINDKSVNGLITDYKLFVKQEFEIDNNVFFIELGGSLMNNGTSYTFKKNLPIGDSNENVVLTQNEDFGYTAMNITAGYTFNKFDIGLGMYFSNGYSILKNASEFKLPYIKMNYKIY